MHRTTHSLPHMPYTIYYHVTKSLFLDICTFFSGACGFFALSAWGHHLGLGGRFCTTAQALGAQSREIWQVITGSLSAELEPSKTMECQPFCSTAVKGSNTVTTIASSFPRSHNDGHYYACVDYSYAMCGHAVCVYVLCVRVYGSVHV